MFYTSKARVLAASVTAQGWYIGLARTILYTVHTHVIFGREITKYTKIQSLTVYSLYSIRCTYTVLANPAVMNDLLIVNTYTHTKPGLARTVYIHCM